MLSKYNINPDFFDVEDTKPEEIEAWTLPNLRSENLMLTDELRKVNSEIEGVLIQEYEIAGYERESIKVTVYTPEECINEKTPCILNIHGGGFVSLAYPHHIRYSVQYAKKLKCRVAIVDYSSAIEKPYPAPVEDCYNSLIWVFENSEELHVDSKRIAIFGDSAGGAIAAAVCQMARDRGASMPCYQMLIYPVTDSTCSSDSANKYTDTPGFYSAANKLMWEIYLKNGDGGIPQYAAPLLAKDLSGLPPAYVELTEFDCLHDEGKAYAEKLQQAGVKVEVRELTGAFHGFDMWEDRDFTKEAVENRVNVLKKVFA